MNRCQHFNNLIKKMGNIDGGGNLPAEYKQVEYLQSSGTQYISTNVISSNALIFEFRAAKDNTGYGGAGNGFFGIRNGSSAYQFVSIVEDNVAIGYGTNSVVTSKQIVHNVANNYVAHFIHGLRKLEMDNVLLVNDRVDYISIQLRVFMFAINDYSRVSNPLRGMIYYMKIYNADTNELLRDFVPCYRQSDRKPGMYDTVTKQFFTNSGSGEFILGPNA